MREICDALYNSQAAGAAADNLEIFVAVPR
jgi:hypothetical protein